MKIGINASFARKSNTGIGRVTLNALKALSNFQFSIFNFQSISNNLIFNEEKIEKDLKFILYLEEDLPKDFNLPKNFTKRIFLPLWKRDDLIRKIWWEKYLLPKKVKEDKCDVFLSLYQCPTVLNKIKHIMIVHDIIPKLFSEYLNNSRKRLYWKLTEKAIKKADKIIAVSEHTKKDLIKYLGVKDSKISVNHIDVDEIYEKEVSEEKSREVLEKYNLKSSYIYSGGGLEARKNMGRLLKAYKLLLKNFEFRISNFDSNSNDRISNEKKEINNSKLSNSEFNQNSKFKIPNLVISGKLMPELAPLVTDVEKLIKDLKLQGKVKLLDFVPQEDLPALYKNASIFVYPSLYEGFGLPVLEAMNCGVPVICSDRSSLSEIVSTNYEFYETTNKMIKRKKRREYAALLFNPENTKDIAKKIEKVLSDKNLRNELSAKGREQAKKFSWDKFMEKVLAFTVTL